MQDRFGTRALADRIAGHELHDSRIGDAERRLIEGADMFFLATADADGRPDCSYKGGDPGFVRVLDERTLAFPSYDGNGLFVSFGNVLVNAYVGLLFIDFEKGHRLRVNGTATIDPADQLLASYSGALLVVRVRTTLVYPNCKRYVHRLTPVERSPFVPRPEEMVPVPNWKREEWARDTLPAADPARDPWRPELPAAPGY